MKNLIEFLKQFSPPNASLNEILILGPYPSAKFFDEIITQFNPQKITLIADSSATQSALKIKESIPKNIQFNLIFVTSPNKGGLVHSKIYFLKWKNNNKFKRVLFLGSANASINGFSTNSETLQAIPILKLKEKSRTILKSYLLSLRRNDNVTRIILNLDSGSKIWLPSILIADEKNIDFASWIRRGIICHKFDQENTFGKFNIHLKKPLPKTISETAFASHGFTKKTKKAILSREYVKSKDKKGKSSWKGQYFTETWFGHWTSFECYNASLKNQIKNSDEDIVKFTSSNNKTNKHIIDEILTAKTSKTKKWQKECLTELSAVYNQLIDNKKTATKYFQIKNKEIDESFYLEKMAKKIQRDHNKATVNSFRERYITGYIFQKVPTLGEADNEFMIGLCDSLLNSGLGYRITNKLVKSLVNCLGDKFYEANDGEELLEIIQENWVEIKEKVMKYHEQT